MSKASQNKTEKDLPRLPDAASLMRSMPIPGQNLLIGNDWLKLLGEPMVKRAVETGKLTLEQAQSACYLYFPQADGSLFASAAITATPGLILGTQVPPGAWQVRQ